MFYVSFTQLIFGMYSNANTTSKFVHTRYFPMRPSVVSPGNVCFRVPFDRLDAIPGILDYLKEQEVTTTRVSATSISSGYEL